MLLEIFEWKQTQITFIYSQVCVRSISVQGQQLTFDYRSDNLPDKHAIWFDREEFCDDSYYDNNRVPRLRPISATSRQS